MDDLLRTIADQLEKEVDERLNKCGLMYRLFSRVKTEKSLNHKMLIKGDKYRSGDSKIQDMIGLRIVAYFQDDVEALSFFYACSNVVDSSIDELDSTTFRPQRLNLTCSIPEKYVEGFRKALPADYAEYIDNTYEVQIRTIFSEGWHEVEHDMRYKCKEDWAGCDSYSRTLNGLIATLETAEWNMKALFDDMSRMNMRQGNYRAMLRNKLHLRIKNDDFSAPVNTFLVSNPSIAEAVLNMDRMILILTMLNHEGSISLTYDNLLFLINRIEMNNPELQALESDEVRQMLDDFLTIG